MSLGMEDLVSLLQPREGPFCSHGDSALELKGRAADRWVEVDTQANAPALSRLRMKPRHRMMKVNPRAGNIQSVVRNLGLVNPTSHRNAAAPRCFIA